MDLFSVKRPSVFNFCGPVMFGPCPAKPVLFNTCLTMAANYSDAYYSFRITYVPSGLHTRKNTLALLAARAGLYRKNV